MKLVALCLMAVVALGSASPAKYTDRFDSIDLKQLIENRRLLIPYILCILEKGKCTNEGRELKSHIAEALENNCANCTDAQLKGTKIMIGHLINKEPEYWNQLVAKYDPQRKYVAKYEKELKIVKA